MCLAVSEIPRKQIGDITKETKNVMPIKHKTSKRVSNRENETKNIEKQGSNKKKNETNVEEKN
jgi:hypothetical protein